MAMWQQGSRHAPRINLSSQGVYLLPYRKPVATVIFACAALTAAMACAQGYPVKPVRIVTTAAGGGSDFVARLIAQGLTESLGQQTIVDNRGTLIAIEMGIKAPPDGYTLSSFGSTLWLLPLMQEKPAYDPVKDFAPITWAVTSPNIIVVHPSLPVKSVRDLIALAKARPGQLNYGTTGSGGSNHLAGELFKSMAGVDMVRINYKGASQSLADLLGGQIQVMFPTPNSASSHVKSGRLKALAVGSAQPSALFPGLPSVAASGLPGYESVALYGMLAPAKTPMPLISRLSQDISRFVNRTDLKEKLFSMGVEAVGSSPDEFAAAMRADIARMGKVIRDAGIKAD